MSGCGCGANTNNSFQRAPAITVGPNPPSVNVSNFNGDIYIQQGGAAWSFNGVTWVNTGINVGSGASNSEIYNRLTPMPITVGGATAGTTFSNRSMQQVFDTILYPFVPATTNFNISSLAMAASTLGTGISALSSYAEKGGIVSGVTMNFGKSANSDVFTADSIQRGANTADSMAGISSPFTKSGLALVYNTVSADLGFVYSAAFTTAGTITKTDTVNFISPSYYGVGANTLLTGVTNVIQMASALPSSKHLRTAKGYSATFNPSLQRYYFVYPSVLGDLTSIIDPNGFNVTASFTKTTMVVTLIDGVTTETYNVYQSNNDTSQSSFTLTFN